MCSCITGSRPERQGQEEQVAAALRLLEGADGNSAVSHRHERAGQSYSPLLLLPERERERERASERERGRASERERGERGRDRLTDRETERQGAGQSAFPFRFLSVARNQVLLMTSRALLFCPLREKTSVERTLSSFLAWVRVGESSGSLLNGFDSCFLSLGRLSMASTFGWLTF